MLQGCEDRVGKWSGGHLTGPAAPWQRKLWDVSSRRELIATGAGSSSHITLPLGKKNIEVARKK